MLKFFRASLGSQSGEPIECLYTMPPLPDGTNYIIRGDHVWVNNFQASQWIVDKLDSLELPDDTPPEIIARFYQLVIEAYLFRNKPTSTSTEGESNEFLSN